MRVQRDTLGAVALMRELRALDPDVEVLRGDCLDGLGVQREYILSGQQWLAPLMVLLAEKDPRIQSTESTERGVLVRFVPTIRADTSEPYDIQPVVAVLTEPQ